MSYRNIIPFLLLCPLTLFAGGVIKVKDAGRKYLMPEKIEVRTTINNHLALTITKQTFRNRGNSPAEMQYGFPVPQNARVIDFRWWQHGKARRATIRAQEQDSASANPGGSADEAFISHAGSNPFFFNINQTLQPDSTIIVELRYIELLENFRGQVDYSYPLRKFNGELFEFSLNLSVRSNWGVRDLKSESHAGVVGSSGDSTLLTIYNPSISDNRDVLVRYTLPDNSYGLSLMSSVKGEGKGYYLLQARPEPKKEQNDSVRRSIVFLMDVSESMRGAKFAFEKQALKHCIRNLSPNDRFNIVEFNETILERFSWDFVQADSASLANGQNFIDSRQIRGKTNISSAILAAMDQNFPDDAVKMIILFSDGRSDINMKAIESRNSTRKISLYCCAVGYDADTKMMAELAEKNLGSVEHLLRNKVEPGIDKFFGKISSPLLIQPLIGYSPQEVAETFPYRQPDVYGGEQLMQVGRYDKAGPAMIKISGTNYSGETEYNYTDVFSGDSTEHYLIPKLWAKYKIDELISFITKNPSDQMSVNEWRKEVIAMSLEHNIQSPFTSFRDEGADTIKTGEGGSTAPVFETGPLAGAEIRAYPNPFSERTEIVFTMPESLDGQELVVEIFSLSGELVRVIYRGRIGAGANYFFWDGRNDLDAPVPAGLYLCRITTGGMQFRTKLYITR